MGCRQLLRARQSIDVGERISERDVERRRGGAGNSATSGGYTGSPVRTCFRSTNINHQHRGTGDPTRNDTHGIGTLPRHDQPSACVPGVDGRSAVA